MILDVPAEGFHLNHVRGDSSESLLKLNVPEVETAIARAVTFAAQKNLRVIGFMPLDDKKRKVVLLVE